MAQEKSLILFSLLALVLLVLGWVQPSIGQGPRAMKFRRQHMDSNSRPNPNSTYCNQMMRRPRMTVGACKPVNIFVHETLKDVEDICIEPNILCKNGQNNCHKSKFLMNVTVSRLTNGSRYPKCKYHTSPTMRQITVACVGNPYVPVHLDA